jgi:hypothetical protein
VTTGDTGTVAGVGRRVFAIVLVLAALGAGALPACETTTPERTGANATATPSPQTRPREDVTLTGRILGPDGRPLANHAVTVDAVRPSNFGDALFATFGTLGLACFADAFFDPSTNVCLPEDGSVSRYRGRTNRDGRYSIVLPSAHYVGEESNTDFFLRVTLPPRPGQRSGAAAEYELEVIDAIQDAPDLRLWDPGLTITPSGGRARADWTPFPTSNAEVGVVASHPVDATFGRPGAVFDLYLVEDLEITLRLTANVDVRKSRTTYHQRHLAPIVPFKGSFVPLSRGKPCTPAPCGLTDGDLATNAATPTAPVVDLGTAVPVWLVVAHGCAGCAVSVSTDNVAFHPLGTADRNGRVRAPLPEPARFVRVDGAPQQLNEVSAWQGERIRGVAAAGAITDGAADLRPPPRTLVAVIAAAALLVAALLGLVARGRRKAS